jgi:Domain of unknown function (DUF4398)
MDKTLTVENAAGTTRGMRTFAFWTALGGLALSGCGPIQSTALLLDAEVDLEAAKTAGADRFAPYEYTSAALYIHKAREEAGYSDFQVAVDFAKKAQVFAKEAKERTLAQKAAEPTPLVPLVP